MAMKNGHAPYYWVGEVHNDVDGATERNIHGVQPHWIGNRLIVFSVRQEMDLMDMHRVQFTSGIDDPPMLERPNFCPHHRSVSRRELFSVDIEALLVFCERHGESRWTFFFRRKVECFEFRLQRTFCSPGR